MARWASSWKRSRYAKAGKIGPKLDIKDNAEGSGITPASMAGVDVAIEFSQPEAVLPNIEAAARAGVNLVVGTTGWSDQRSKVEQIVRESGIGLIYGANFSLGMNLFFEIVSHSARIMGMIPQYDAYLSEEHHRAKKDAPSGTALNLLDMMRPHLKQSESQHCQHTRRLDSRDSCHRL